MSKKEPMIIQMPDKDLAPVPHKVDSNDLSAIINRRESIAFAEIELAHARTELQLMVGQALKSIGAQMNHMLCLDCGVAYDGRSCPDCGSAER